MIIAGLGTAVPSHRYTQADCWFALSGSKQFQHLSDRSRTLLKKILLGNNGIAARHFVLDDLSGAFDLRPETLQARFQQHAPALAAAAARSALDEAQLTARQVDAVIVSSCTGYLCPGLSSYVSGELGLRRDVLALDLVGQGCGAALPNLRTAEAILGSQPAATVLSVCVEVCSAAFYLDDDPGVLVSTCLFGDGAGAAILRNQAAPDRRVVEWKAARSLLDPGARDMLRFTHRQGMLRNVLTKEVPAFAAEAAAELFEETARASEVRKEEIAAWILHAGGRDVLAALKERLHLDEAALVWSAAVLRDVGNVSSPFVFHVLERALRDNAPPGFWWMSSFGAGFACHGALLKVD